MKECVHCKNIIDDDSKVCKFCGYTFEGREQERESITEKADDECKNNIEDDGQETNTENSSENNLLDTEKCTSNNEKKKRFLNTKNKIMVSCVVIFMIVCVIVLYTNSDSYKYDSAMSEYDNENYAIASEKFEKLGNYKDAQEMCEVAKHKEKVKNDEVLPIISEVPATIKLKKGDNFDGEQWLSDNNVTATDDVTEDISCTIDSSQINIEKAGEYVLYIYAQDEAGNRQSEKVDVLVKQEYTQKEIEEAVKSTYAKEIPGLDRIEYDAESQTVWVYLVNDGMAEAAMGAKMNATVKRKWDELTDTFDSVSEKIRYHLLGGGYDDISYVNIMVLNDLNKEKMLYVTSNGTKMVDVTD